MKLTNDRKDRTKIIREKEETKKRITKHRDRRYTKSEVSAMEKLLSEAKAIIYS